MHKERRVAKYLSPRRLHDLRCGWNEGAAVAASIRPPPARAQIRRHDSGVPPAVLSSAAPALQSPLICGYAARPASIPLQYSRAHHLFFFLVFRAPIFSSFHYLFFLPFRCTVYAGIAPSESLGGAKVTPELYISLLLFVASVFSMRTIFIFFCTFCCYRHVFLLCQLLLFKYSW